MALQDVAAYAFNNFLSASIPFGVKYPCVQGIPLRELVRCFTFISPRSIMGW